MAQIRRHFLITAITLAGAACHPVITRWLPAARRLKAPTA
jgi:hypothetical protein